MIKVEAFVTIHIAKFGLWARLNHDSVLQIMNRDSLERVQLLLYRVTSAGFLQKHITNKCQPIDILYSLVLMVSDIDFSWSPERFPLAVRLRGAGHAHCCSTLDSPGLSSSRATTQQAEA